MGSQYGAFAKLYDLFMAGTDYVGWVDYIQRIFEKNGVQPELLLDLGCGTGKAARMLAEKGYDVIGVDNSAEMLSIAKGLDPESLYIMQDIRSLELYGTVGAVISLCDVMNYLLTPRELFRVFSLVYNYLDPGGLFVFDINSLYKYRKVLRNGTFTRQTGDAAFIWENRYYAGERVNEYRLTFFEKQDGGLYRRFRERHLQRAYSVKLLRRLLERAGLTVSGVYGEKTFSPPKPDEQRIFFVARK
jgi:SAM-dependent methyltransferase